MTQPYNDDEYRIIPRVSWGAILAGGLTALAVSVLLNLLGIGIGFTSINPVAESDPLSGLGTGTVIWWVVSNLIALFAGGMVAGRMAGFVSGEDGALHGFLSWCVYTAVTLFFITSTVGSVISGVTGAVSSVFGGGDDQQTVVQVNSQQQQSQDRQGVTFRGIEDRFFELLNKAERYDILPGNTVEEVRETLDEGTASLRNAWQELNLDRNVAQFVKSLDVNIDESGNLQISAEGDFIERGELKDYLVENTDLSEQEIEQRIDQWNQDIDEAINEVESLYQDAKQQLEESGAQLADTMATISLVTFVVFLFGVLAASGGGLVAARSNPTRLEHDSRSL